MARCDRGRRRGEFPRGFRLPRGVDRREILKASIGGAGIVALGPWVDRHLPVASGAPLGQEILVVVNMDGGCDTTNVVVPKTLSNYYTRRPTIQVPAGAELAIGPTYGFHPAMPKLRAMFDAGDVAVVNKVGYPDENLSHFESQDVYSFAARTPAESLGLSPAGWIARYADLYAPTPMGAVSIGAGRPTALSGGTTNPLQVSSVSSFRFASDVAFPSNHLHRLDTVRKILSRSTTAGTPGEVKAALDGALGLSDQLQAALGSFSSVATYPSSSPGRALRDVAVLVQGGFETRVFYTVFGGFDTHGAEGAVAPASGGLPGLLQALDDGVDAFRQDMVAMGQWDRVVMVVITEFGRRNYENGSAGTDHGAAYAMLLIGGAVHGGVYGHDVTTGDMAGEYLLYATDFRDVYKEIVHDHLGSNAAPLFPEAQPTNDVLGVC